MRLKKCSLKKLKKISYQRKLVIYGATEFLNQLCRKIGIEESILYVIDNNPYLWGTQKLFGKKEILIQSPEALRAYGQTDFQLVIAAPYYEDIYRQMKEILNEDSCQNDIYFCQSPEDRNLSQFRFLFKHRKLKDRIVFRSGPEIGSGDWDYKDNARALFEYMVDHHYNDNYELIWMVGIPALLKPLKRIKNVRIVSYEWEKSRNPYRRFLYQSILYTSKFFFTTDACRWLRFCRKEQVIINLWHGCGFKARMNQTEPTGTHYNYMTVNSPLYAQIHADIYGCRLDQMLITGLAKQDLQFRNRVERIEKILKIDQKNKFILWLPTFRSKSFHTETGLPFLKRKEDLEWLDQQLVQKNIILAIKQHPSQPHTVRSEWRFQNIKIWNEADVDHLGIQLNELFIYTDALISDYSSAAVDYMLLDKPIAFTVDDWGEYEKNRGFVLNPIFDYLPGKLLSNRADLEIFINEIKEGIDSSAKKRRELMKQMHLYRDGGNCARILRSVGLEKRR